MSGCRQIDLIYFKTGAMVHGHHDAISRSLHLPLGMLRVASDRDGRRALNNFPRDFRPKSVRPLLRRGFSTARLISLINPALRAHF